MDNNWPLIAGIAVITYLSRIAGIEMMAKRPLPPKIKTFFRYVPIAMMTALIANQVVFSEDRGMNLSYPMLFGCIACAVVLQTSKRFLLAVVAGVLVGLTARYLLHHL